MKAEALRRLQRIIAGPAGLSKASIALWVMVPLVLVVPKARASGPVSGADAIIYISGSVVAGVGGMVTGGANLYYAASSSPTPKGWIYSGYVLAGLNLAAGALFVTLGSGEPVDKASLAIGAGHFVVAAGDLIFTIWGHTTSRKAGGIAMVSPAALTDANGCFAPGLTVTWFGW